jgi:hypothetical protein
MFVIECKTGRNITEFFFADMERTAGTAMGNGSDSRNSNGEWSGQQEQQWGMERTAGTAMGIGADSRNSNGEWSGQQEQQWRMRKL